MTPRITYRINKEITPAQFQQAMARYAQAGLRGLEINKAIETEVNEVMARYEYELQCNAHNRNSAFELIRAYCTTNKQNLFAKRRSIGTPHGVAGFRLGTPRLKTEKGSNWNAVVQKLRQLLPDYIRHSEEPAKDLLLADRHKEPVARALMEIGVQIVQDELFYIDTKNAA